MSDTEKRMIVALNASTLREALGIVNAVGDEARAYKLGLGAITQGWAVEACAELRKRGYDVFWDGKFADIPSEVEGASRAVAEMGVWAFTTHITTGGEEALKAAVRGAGGRCLVVGVTALTSVGLGEFGDMYRDSLEGMIPKVLVPMAERAGVGGITCAGYELPAMRGAPGSCGSGLTTVVPGIRPDWAVVGDQMRFVSPQEAIARGADYIVVGRPVVSPPRGVSMREAAERINQEIVVGLRKRAGRQRTWAEKLSGGVRGVR